MVLLLLRQAIEILDDRADGLASIAESHFTKTDSGEASMGRGLSVESRSLIQQAYEVFA